MKTIRTIMTVHHEKPAFTVITKANIGIIQAQYRGIGKWFLTMTIMDDDNDERMCDMNSSSRRTTPRRAFG